MLKNISQVNAEIAQLVEHNLAPKEKGSNLGKDAMLKNISQVNAEIAQLVEHNLAKVGVASSSLVFRSKPRQHDAVFFCYMHISVLKKIAGEPTKATHRFL